MMDSNEPIGGESLRRRQRRFPFRQRKIPVRFLVPNFFTLLSLCAGVTAIRMAIEGRYEFAVGLVVAAALLDGIDGRLARALKAQSRFGAELDSLADFINFGVAPAIVMFTWGFLGPMKSLGWISVLVFACGMGLRLARFNAALDVDKPKWQSNYFTGIPAPAGAISVLLPLYLEGVGFTDIRNWPLFLSLYTLAIAGMLVSTIPTYSGKLLGERISREYVLPLLVIAALFVGLLVTYPSATLATGTILYLLLIPVGYRNFRSKARQWETETSAAASHPAAAVTTHSLSPGQPTNLSSLPAGETKH
jgi:CDP-diacylglycerol--serine O-phosphatidyltransferase